MLTVALLEESNYITLLMNIIPSALSATYLAVLRAEQER